MFQNLYWKFTTKTVKVCRHEITAEMQFFQLIMFLQKDATILKIRALGQVTKRRGSKFFKENCL